MACEIEPDSDLAWCKFGAQELMAGKDYIEAGNGLPFVNRGASSLGSGGTPVGNTSGEIPWGAGGFIIAMPQHFAIKKYFGKNPGRAEYESLLASALLHELVHFRQYRHIDHDCDTAPDELTDKEPETLLKCYYSDPREVEAHAAQIAFLLGPASGGESCDAATVFESNLVGRRISARLDALHGGPLAAEYEGFRTKLTDTVSEWRDRLFPFTEDRTT